ncbi:MAG: hypothetical protein ACKO1L_12205, partial [Brachymonas sp.]
DAKEIKAFIKEYAEDLQHTAAWVKDPGGAQQELLQSWIDNYGKDGSLRFYRSVAATSATKPATKAELDCMNC